MYTITRAVHGDGASDVARRSARSDETRNLERKSNRHVPPSLLVSERPQSPCPFGLLVRCMRGQGDATERWKSNENWRHCHSQIFPQMASSGHRGIAMRIIRSGYDALMSQLDVHVASKTMAHAIAQQRACIHAGPVCLAAPKRKVTPSRKGMRSAGKGVSFVPIVSQCSVCRRIFEPHSLPRSCDEPNCRAGVGKKKTAPEDAP